MESKPFGVIRRRRFLQLAGGATGLAALRPVLSAQEAMASSRRQLRVGVLAPSGSAYPRYAENLLDGMRLHFDESRASIDAWTVVEPVLKGYGGVLPAAEKLLAAGVDVLVADVTAPVASLLGKLATERRTPLVVANIGGHVETAEQKSRYVLTHSLGYWQANFAMGAWTAAHLGRRALVAASIADSGYDTVYAFRQGFKAAGGSLVGPTFVTHTGAPGAGVDSLMAAVRSARPDFVYGLYSGTPAVEVVRAWSRAGFKDVKLAGGGFMVEDDVLSQERGTARGIHSALGWSAALDTAANRTFRESFRSRMGREADAIAVLGYDTAQLVTMGVRRAGGRSGVRDLVSALAGASITSPRGTLRVDGETSHATGRQYIRRVEGTNGTYSNKVVATAPAVSRLPSGLAKLTREPRSGFLNECLCP